MFTGLIEEVGTIQSVRHGARSCVLTIGCRTVLEGSQIGDSIAVNGVCLTVTSMGGSYYTADVMAETMNRSSLGQLSTGAKVNLERRCLQMADLGDISYQVISMGQEPFRALNRMIMPCGIPLRRKRIYCVILWKKVLSPLMASA